MFHVLKIGKIVIQMAGPVFFFCPPMLVFIILLNTIVNEKEKKLRQGMNIMGLSVSINNT